MGGLEFSNSFTNRIFSETRLQSRVLPEYCGQGDRAIRLAVEFCRESRASESASRQWLFPARAPEDRAARHRFWPEADRTTRQTKVREDARVVASNDFRSRPC